MSELKGAKIKGKTEHVLNRKARINGKVVTDGKKLSRIKTYSKKDTKRKVLKLVEALCMIDERETSVSHTCSVSNSGSTYTITLDGNDLDIEINDFSLLTSVKIKRLIRENL